ncbi:hypothetical protein [Fusobacterium ulcerans]
MSKKFIKIAELRTLNSTVSQGQYTEFLIHLYSGPLTLASSSYITISALLDGIQNFIIYSSTGAECLVEYKNNMFKLTSLGYQSDGYAIIYAR